MPTMKTTLRTLVLTLASTLALAGPALAEDAKAPATKTKAGAKATAAVVGKKAPAFTLTDLDGKTVKLADFKDKVVVLEWFNPGCPFVKKSHTVGSLVDTAKRVQKDGVVWLSINSGGAGKQGADPKENVEAVKTFAMTNPVLLDADGTVGKAYGATNTPHMFVIDKKGTLVYAGAIDNSPDGEGKSAPDGKLVNYVDAALGELAAGKAVTTSTTKAYGCGVKYGS